MPTYSTRVMTARDTKLLDALGKSRNPAHRRIAERLSPTPPPEPPEIKAEITPEPAKAKLAPKPAPKT